MEIRRMRGSALILFNKVTELPLLVILAVISLFLRTYEPDILFYMLILALSPLYGILKYISTYYTVEDGYLVMDTGIFNKKKVQLPIAKITSVDLSQNILYQLFKTYLIKIDNSSQYGETAGEAEIFLALKKDRAFEFKHIIMGNTTPEASKSDYIVEITVSVWEFIKLGFLQSKTLFFFKAGPIAIPLISALAVFATGSKSVDELLDRLLVNTFYTIAVIAVFFYLIALFTSLLKSWLTYNNFRIMCGSKTLKIEYGLFHKKKLSIQTEKINAVLFKQNLLLRIFRLYTAEVSVIGYGDGSNGDVQEQAVLYPIATMKQLENIVKRLLPEFEFEFHVNRPESNALRYFFYRPGFAAAALTLVAALIIMNIYVIALAVGIMVMSSISSLLQYSNSGIYCGGNNVIASYGGYRKTVAIIKASGIESITARGSLWKRKKGIVSILIGFVAPLRSANITVYNLPAEKFRLLESTIKY